MYPVRVLGFGDNVVDKYLHIQTMYPGGNCVNFAVYASMLGVERSAYMGYFGDDPEAEHVIRTLEELSVEIYKCRQLHGENGCAKVTIQDGDRVFMGSNLGGIRGKTPWVLDRFDLQYIRGFDLVHSGNFSFMEKEMPKIHEAGVPVSFDFSDCSTWEYKEEVCSWADYVFVSCSGKDLEETREEVRRLVEMGAQLAVATRGGESCVAYDGTQYYERKPDPLKEVKDTMGAGDSFLTAFLVRMLADQKKGVRDIPDCLREASAFAARVCQLEGAFGHGKKFS